MPLSEHEQRLLDQMERALYDDDPKFSARLAEDPQRATTRKRVIIGSAVVLLGLGLVVLGVVTQHIWLGGVGFAVMVAGGGYALAPGGRASLGTVEADGSVTSHRPQRRGMADRLKAGSPGSPSASGSSGSFMQRLEERWDKRRRDGW